MRNEPSSQDLKFKVKLRLLKNLGSKDQAEELRQKLLQMQTASQENEEFRIRVEEKVKALLNKLD